MRSWMEFGYNTVGNSYELEYPRWPSAMPPELFRVYLFHMKRFATGQFINQIKPIVYAGFVFDDGANDTAGGAGFRLVQPPIFLRNAMLNGFAIGDGTFTGPVWSQVTDHPEHIN